MCLSLLSLNLIYTGHISAVFFTHGIDTVQSICMSYFPTLLIICYMTTTYHNIKQTGLISYVWGHRQTYKQRWMRVISLFYLYIILVALFHQSCDLSGTGRWSMSHICLCQHGYYSPGTFCMGGAGLVRETGIPVMLGQIGDQSPHQPTPKSPVPTPTAILFTCITTEQEKVYRKRDGGEIFWI